MTLQKPRVQHWWQRVEINTRVALIGGAFLIAGVVLEQASGWASSSAKAIRNATTPSIENICNRQLPKVDENNPSDKDIASIRNIINACTSVMESGKNDDYKVYLNRGRAIILNWSLGYQQSRLGIEEALDDLEHAASIAAGEPRAFFYQGFARDFRELVSSDGQAIKPDAKAYRELVSSDEEGRSCPLIHNYFKGTKVSEGRYTPAINAYLKKYENTLIAFNKKNTGVLEYAAVSRQKNLSEEEAYILIEIGHWLNNRDRNAKRALQFYKIVLAHYGNSKHQVTHNALVSIGVAYFSEGKATIAKDYFSRALDIEESAEVYNNLGSSLARSAEASYREAAEKYEKAAQREDEAGKKYLFLKSQAYALLLEGILRSELESPEDALAQYDKALAALESAKQFKTDKDDSWREDHSFLTALGMAKYHRAQLTDDYNFPLSDGSSDEFKQEAKTLFSDAHLLNENSPLINGYMKLIDGEVERLDEQTYHLKSVFENPIPHDIGHDLVIDVHHKNFYCLPNDPRFSPTTTFIKTRSVFALGSRTLVSSTPYLVFGT